MSLLTRKYPYPASRRWLSESALYGVVVALILIVFQPFGLAGDPGSVVAVGLAYGAATFVCCAVFNYLVFVRLRERVGTWRIWEHALGTMGLLVSIAVANIGVTAIIFHTALTPRIIGLFCAYTLIIGAAVTVLSIGVGYNRSLRYRLAELLDQRSEEHAELTAVIHDTAARGADLTLPINNFLYAEAQRNSVTVYALDADGHLAKHELRTTLTAVLADLAAFPNVFQAHRSFVVNVDNITAASGNSAGYQLQLRHCPNVVPVSRSYVAKLRSFIA